MKQLKDSLAAIDVPLDAKAMAALDAVSAPPHGGYPCGAFGTAPRARTFETLNGAVELTREGSDAPLGRT